MIILLSPAKTLDYENKPIINKMSSPLFLKQSEILIDALKRKNTKEIASLMKLSDKLAELNCDRYKGISAKDDYYECHFGITNDDPKHRDTGEGLGVSWRRLISMNMLKIIY